MARNGLRSSGGSSRARLARTPIDAVVNLFLALLVFAFLLAGEISLAALLWAVAVAALSTLVAYHIFYPRFEHAHFHLSFPHLALGIVYLVVLVRNIFLSSFSVARIILTGRTRPRVVRIRTRLKNPTARVIMALSITLMPGTMTVDMNGPYIYVHWLRATTSHTVKAGDIIKGDLERLLHRMFEAGEE